MHDRGRARSRPAENVRCRLRSTARGSSTSERAREASRAHLRGALQLLGRLEGDQKAALLSARAPALPAQALQLQQPFLVV